MIEALPNRRGEPVVDLARAPHRIGKVTLGVRDLDRVSAFYRTVIGLEVVEHEPASVGLGVDGVVLVELLHWPEAAPQDRREAGLFHTAFLLPKRTDLGSWLTFALAAGVRLTGASDHLVSEALYLDDPEGNGVEIYVDRPSSAWTRMGDHIRMVSDPLDLSELMRQAQGLPWRGFPANGVVGHVHLQVGDLDVAQTFYEAALGFGVTCTYPGARFFGSGGYHHQLAANTWNSAGSSLRPKGSAGLARVELIVTPQLLKETRSRMRLQDNGRFDPLTVLDPWGTNLVLRALR